jgi:hypothetical protein
MNSKTIFEGNFQVSKNLDLTRTLFPEVSETKDFKYFYGIYLDDGEVQPVFGYLTNSLKPGETLGLKNDFRKYLSQHHPTGFSDLLFLLDHHRLEHIHGPIDYDHGQIQKTPVVDDILKPSKGLILWHYQLEQLFACFYQSQTKAIELRKAVNQKQAFVFELAETLEFKSGVSLGSILNDRMIFPVTCSPNLKGAITLYSKGGLIMEAKLVVNGVEMKLGHGPLKFIAGTIQGYVDGEAINHELAKHPSSAVRKVVADGEVLEDKTVRLLLKDNCIDVLKNIVTNDSAAEIMTKKDIAWMISKKDPRLSVKLVEYMGDYRRELQEFIAEKLIDHPDPYVRYSLAETSSTPKKFLEKLTKDPDVDIAEEARETIDDLNL